MAGCGTCAICLAELEVEEEAFLDECFHHFHLQCIRRWAESQLGQEHDRGPPALGCPLCRRPFASAIYDCRDSAYRRQFFLPASRSGGRRGVSAAAAANGSGEGGSGSLPLTAQHRRRRAAYFSPLDAPRLQGLQQQRLMRPQAHRLDVEQFVVRELEALLLQQDVGLVAQHIVGTLQNAAASPPAASRGANGLAGSRPRLMLPHSQHPAAAAPASLAIGAPLPEVAAKVAAAAAPFLFQQAEQFAWEVAAFAATSGSSVAAYDRQMLQLDAAAAAAAGAEARQQLLERQRQQQQLQRQPAQRRGRHRSDGSGSEDGGRGGYGVSSSSEGPADWRQQSIEPQRSGSEGYLELLMHQQGKGRQQQEQEQHEGGSGQQERAAGHAQTGGATEEQQGQQQEAMERSSGNHGAGTGPETTHGGSGSSREESPVRRQHRKQRSKHKRRKGSPGSSRGRKRSRKRSRSYRSRSRSEAGAAAGRPSSELAALQQQALLALGQHKQQQEEQQQEEQQQEEQQQDQAA